MADGHSSVHDAQAYAVFDRSAEVVVASSGYARLVSATAETLLGESVETIFGASERGGAVAQRLHHTMNRVLASSHGETLEWLRFPFEIERVFRVQVHPLAGSKGKTEAVLQVVTEVPLSHAFGDLFGAERVQASMVLHGWPAVGAVLVGPRFVVEASTSRFDELTLCAEDTIGRSVFDLFPLSQIDDLVHAGDSLMGIAPRLEGANACLEGRGTDGDRTPDIALHITPIVDQRTTVAVLVLGPLLTDAPDSD